MASDGQGSCIFFFFFLGVGYWEFDQDPVNIRAMLGGFHTMEWSFTPIISWLVYKLCSTVILAHFQASQDCRLKLLKLTDIHLSILVASKCLPVP